MRKSNGVSESADPLDTQRKRILLLKHVLIKLTLLVMFITGFALLSSAFVSDSANYPAPVVSEVLGVSRLPVSEETPGVSIASAATAASAVSYIPKISELSDIPSSSESASNESNQRLVVPFFYMGDQIGTLRIPAVDMEVNVYQGDSEDEFRLGAGHYAGSLFPGQDGNVVIASHNTTYFRDFEYLLIGDLINLETTYGQFIYQIREIQILETEFNSIVMETEKEQLTMNTCYPFNKNGGATGRFVVICDLIGSDLT